MPSWFDFGSVADCLAIVRSVTTGGAGVAFYGRALGRMSDESRRTVDTLYQARHAEAMRSLLATPGSLRIACAGFGIDMLLRRLGGVLPNHDRGRGMVGPPGPPHGRQLGDDWHRALLVHGHRRASGTHRRSPMEQRSTVLTRRRRSTPIRQARPLGQCCLRTIGVDATSKYGD